MERWRSLIVDRANDLPVLEIGCGNGDDSAFLQGVGCDVLALDKSPIAIAEARLRVPEVAFHCQDMRDPFPLPAGIQVGVIVASLSLHYFEWNISEELVERILSALVPGGVLLCRLNSTKDVNYGAQGHPELDENYYLVDGEPKRFFDKDSVCRLFTRHWHIIAIEEVTIAKYKLPKVVWEVVLERIS